MKRIFYIIFLFINCTSLIAQLSGTLDGDTLKAEFSPYHVIGNVDVVDLVIEPGVTLLFDGHYDFRVIDGLLKAEGFYNDSIIFMPDTNLTDAWDGMLFQDCLIPSTLKYCRINGSRDFGIRISNGIAPNISNCKIDSNDDRGIEILRVDFQLSNCIIENNLTAGIYLDNANVSIYNSIIAKNDNAGILSNDNNDSLNIINTVIAENIGTGLLSSADGIINVVNSIIYYNTSEISTPPAHTQVTYSDIRRSSVYQGIGNINDPPQFANFSNYTLFSLQPNPSPCIDAGNPDVFYNDLYFPPSYGINRNDMGAYGGPLAGEWYPALYIQPDSLNFGRVSYDSTITIGLNIRNYRDAIILADSIYLVGNDTSTFSLDTHYLNINVFDSAYINISFTPDRQGLFSSVLVFETINHGKFFVPVTGQGVVSEFNYSVNELDFGNVALGDTFTLDFPIINSGDDTLKIFQIQTTRTEFTVSDTILNIDPYNSRDTLSVKFIPVLIDSLIDSLIMFTNDPNEGRVSFPIYGQGFGSIINVDSSAYNFGSVFLTLDSVQNVNINNNGNDSLIINDIQITANDSNTFYLINDSISFIEPDSNFVLQIGFEPTILGIDSAELVIESDDVFNPIVSIPLKGYGIAPVFRLESENLDFGIIPFNTTLTDSIMIRNTGNYNLFIDQDSLLIYGDDPEFFKFDSVQSYTIFPDDSGYIYISFNATTEGLKQAVLQIVTNDPINSKEVVELRGESFAPHILSPTKKLDFGNVIKDSVASLSAYIYNNGLGSLVIYEDSLNIDGADSAYFQVDSVEKYTIEYQDSSFIKVSFNATIAAENFAVLNIVNNDPDSHVVFIDLEAFVLIPFIDLPERLVDFGVIPLSSVATQLLTIKNGGYDDLTIYYDSLEIVGEEAQYFKIDSIPSDSIIQPHDSIKIKLLYSADSVGTKNAELKIRSDDQVLPEVSVALAGSSDTPQISLSNTNISFGTVKAYTDTSISLIVFNNGAGNLILYKDDLLISGRDSLAFSIPLNDTNLVIEPMDSAQIIVELNTDNVGPKLADLELRSNDYNQPFSKIPLSALIIDNMPAAISIDESHSNSEFILGQNATLRFIVTTNFPTDSVILNYREGGTIGFNKAYCIDLGQFNMWEIVIDSTWITTQGFEYYLTVFHGWTNTDWPHKARAVPVLINNYTYPLKTKEGMYQQISIPFNTSNQTLSDLFLDDLGPYDNTLYRFFDCVDGNNYIELPNLDSSIPSGKSMWLVTKNAIELDYTGAKTVLTDTSFQMALHSGWNMISTPFNFPIFWNSVTSSIQLWYYAGTGWQFASILEPHKGYSIYVENDTILSIPANEYNPVITPKPNYLISNNYWSINLKITQNDLEDHFNFAGVRENALSGIDKFDQHEPPPIGQYVSLYFTELNYVSNKLEKFSTDLKEANSDGYIFDFEVKGNVSGKKELHIETNSLPDDYNYMVINPTSKVKYELGTIPLYSNNYTLNLIVGTEEFVNQNTLNYYLTPIKFQLGQNYPNPFNPDTQIRFQIPELSKISLDIYNILGQKIKILLNNIEKDAGYYQVNWDGKNNVGNHVASGIYFLNFRSKKFSKSIKMLLQR